MKTAVSLPDDLFKKADAFAAKKNWSRSKLFAEAVDDYLNRHDEDEITRKLNKLAKEVDTSLDPAYEAAIIEVLLSNEW